MNMPAGPLCKAVDVDCLFERQFSVGSTRPPSTPGFNAEWDPSGEVRWMRLESQDLGEEGSDTDAFHADLDSQLDEVKELFRAKFGHDVDSDSEVLDALEIDGDGTTWIKTVGQGLPAGPAGRDRMLDEVKQLFRAKFGHDVDSDS